MKLLIGLVLLSSSLFSQTFNSVLQEELDYYNQKGILAEDYYSVNQPSAMNRSANSNCQLNKMVFGWHPYWQNGLETNYDWNLISDFCYFSYELDASTGNASTTHSFETVSVIDDALSSGTKVHLCVTLFSSHATFRKCSSKTNSN